MFSSLLNFYYYISYLSLYKARLLEKIGQLQEKIHALSTQQQQEAVKALDQRNKLLAQVGEGKAREETMKTETDRWAVGNN